MKKILLGLSIIILASCGNNSNSIETKFEWDFSKQKKYVYSFSQTVFGDDKMSKTNPVSKTYTNANGYLNVSVKENNLADLSLTDIEMKMV